MKHCHIQIAILSLLLFLGIGCKAMKEQVVEPTSETLSLKEKFFIHHEDGIDIIYSFWTNGGVMAFVIYNNSDKPIYIDWKKSSFIYGGQRLVYWEDKELITTVGVSANKTSSGMFVKNLYSPFKAESIGVGTFNEATVVDKEERITFIPPRSKYFKSSYALSLKPFSMKDAKNEEVQRTDKPEKTTQIKVLEFDKNSSPLVFRNYITWSFDEKFSVENHVDDEFFVKKITSMFDNHFRGGSDKNFIDKMPFASPNKFYIEFFSKK